MTARAILVLAIAAACGPSPTPAAVTPVRASTTSAIAPSRVSFHPLPSGWKAFDAIDLAEGVRLVVGASGQRWIVTTIAAPTDADPDATRIVLEAAPAFAPEDLVAVRRRPRGFVFVGETGTTYFAANALDDFTSRRTPPEPIRTAAAGKQAIVGITTKDTLVRSIDDGATWSPLAMPRSSAIPIAVAASPLGEALIIAAPARLWASVDDLATVRPINTEGIGPTEVFASDDQVWARGLSPAGKNARNGLATLANTHAMLKRAPDGSPALEVSGRYPPRVYRDGDEDLGFADSVRRGQAVWVGKRYLELRPSSDAPNVPHAVTARDSTVEHLAKIPAATDCEIAALAADGNLVEAECAHDVAGRRMGLLLRSLDFGATFSPDGELEWGQQSEHHVWVSARGSVIVDSTCVAPEPSCGEAGLVVRPRGSTQFVASTLPAGLHAHVHRLRISADGQRVYGVAFDQDDAKIVLLISKDAGRSFAVAPLPEPDGEAFVGVLDLALDDATHTVVVIAEHDPPLRFATRDDGATWDTARLPFVADSISIAAKRGLAVTGRGVAWETHDAGATWGEVAIPRPSPPNMTLDVACSEQACMVGDLAIRDGWASARDVKPATPIAPKPPAHRPLLRCTADGPEIAFNPTTGVSLAPTPALAWLTADEDPAGVVDVITLARGSRTIVRTSLLAAPNVPSGTRIDVGPDGVIAVRAPRDAPGMVDVEVAWWVASTGKVHRATIPGAIPQLAKLPIPDALAAIAPGYGAYVHLPNTPLWLIRETGAASQIAVPAQFPAVKSLWARRIGARTEFFGGPSSISREHTLAVATLPDRGPFEAFTWNLWPRSIERTRPATTSVLAAEAIVAWPGSDEIAPRTWSIALRAGAEPPEPVPLPTAQDDLKPCATGATGSRVSLPWVAGSRTPVVVEAGNRTLYQATENVVARVGKSACAIGIEAGPLYGPRATQVTLISADDLRGFAFMPNHRAEVAIPIACALANGPLPAAFANARGM